MPTLPSGIPISSSGLVQTGARSFVNAANINDAGIAQALNYQKTKDAPTGQAGSVTPTATVAPTTSATTTSTTSSPAVVTAKEAEDNWKLMATTTNGIKNGMLSQSVVNQGNKALPTIPGYNVSATPTGVQGEQEATNNATGSKYYIAPQAEPAKGGMTQEEVHAMLTSNESETPTSGTQGQMDTENATYKEQTKAELQTLDNAYNDYKTQIQQLASGTFPLTGAQKALVDSTSQAFDQMINQANLKGAALASETGGFSNKVSATLGELTNIESVKAASIAKLEQGFQENNYKLVSDSYNAFLDAEKTKTGLLDKLHQDTISQLKDMRDQELQITKDVNSVKIEAAKNGADAKTLAAIGSSKDLNGAISAAGSYLQTGTGMLADYLQYKRQAESQGLVPLDYQSYKDREDNKESQRKINEAVAIHKANTKSDAALTASDTVQQKLEQQYRGVLSKEFSSRTGALGVENSKVNQANHLNALFSQYYDPKTKQYNIPKVQYAELAIGLANLVSPTGVVSDSARDAIMQSTAKGDFNKAISYITGTPQNGTTQDVIKNLIDSVDRQAETAVNNRNTALQNLRDQAPTDLEPARVERLNKSTNMVEYAGMNRVAKSYVDTYVRSNPTEVENIAKLYEVPGATDKDIYEYLKAQGKI